MFKRENIRAYLIIYILLCCMGVVYLKWTLSNHPVPRYDEVFWEDHLKAYYGYEITDDGRFKVCGEDPQIYLDSINENGDVAYGICFRFANTVYTENCRIYWGRADNSYSEGDSGWLHVKEDGQMEAVSEELSRYIRVDIDQDFVVESVLFVYDFEQPNWISKYIAMMVLNFLIAFLFLCVLLIEKSPIMILKPEEWACISTKKILRGCIQLEVAFVGMVCFEQIGLAGSGHDFDIERVLFRFVLIAGLYFVLRKRPFLEGYSYETVYLFIMGLVVYKTLLPHTAFVNDGWPDYIDWILRMALCVLILVRVGNEKRVTVPKLLWMFLMIWAFFMSWHETAYDFLLDIPLLMVGALCVPYKKILKTGFWTALGVCIACMLEYFLGVTWEVVYLRGAPPEHAFGMVYPLDYAALVCYLLIFAWVLYSDYGVLWLAILAAVLAWFVYDLSGARTSGGILALAVVGILYETVRTRYFAKNDLLNKVCTGLEWMIPLSIPAAAALCLGLTMRYDGVTEWLNWINRISTGRLGLGKTAIEKYGFHLFGSHFDITANFFVDSAYVLTAVRYGMIPFVLMCLLVITSCVKALRRKHLKIAIAILLMAGHSVMEHRCITPAYSFFLMLPFADFGEGESPVTETGKKMLFNGYMCMVGLIGALSFTTMAKFFRTAINSVWRIGSLKNLYFLAGAMLVLFIIYRFLYYGWIETETLVSQRSFDRQAGKGLLIYGAMLVLFFVMGAVAIGHGFKTYANTLQKERPVLRELTECGEIQGIYIDDVPLLYRGESDKIRFSLYRQEGLVGKENIALITTNERNVSLLRNNGFACAEISPIHRLYTNSEEAIHRLSAQGIEWSD